MKYINWIYERSGDNTSRYVLGTVGNKPLVCIGVNPSTAEPRVVDNTIKSVIRISEANGYDSWIMLNLYPQRATDPRDMHDVCDYSLLDENLAQIENIIKNRECAIWASWGTLIVKRGYLLNCLYQIVDIARKYDCEWFYAGKPSKLGHPHHPLYLKKTEILKEFGIDEYIRKASAESVFSYIRELKNHSIACPSDFIEALTKAELLDGHYRDKLSTRPIDVDAELRALPNADYYHTRAILTAIIREEYFLNGTLTERIENGEILEVLKRLKKLHERDLL